MILCVYAIAPRPRRPVRARGLRGERLIAVGGGRVAAIAGSMPRPPHPTAANLAKFDRTMSALSQELPAILPARFGTSFDNLDELAFVLQSRARTFQASLRNVRGRVQMTVRMADRDAQDRPRRLSPVAASGAAYLRDRAAAAARERRVAGFEPVRDAVDRYVRDERVERRQGAVAVYHLVPARSVDRYVRAITRGAQHAGMPIRVSGPFAPYAFTGW